MSKLVLSGRILDLGGSKKSGYHELIGGEHTIEVVNMDDTCIPDIYHDLEKPLVTIGDATYDGVLCINTLEHIYEYQQLLRESYRVLRPSGTLVIGVPFIMPVHPSPRDFWRFTDEALKRILADSGFTQISIIAVGRGPFTAGEHVKFNAYRFGIVRQVSTACAWLIDVAVGRLSARQTKVYYPLGYYIIAQKT